MAIPHLHRRRFLTLAAVGALAVAGARARAIADRPAAVVHWHDDTPGFGGFSAIEVSADRREALVLSDRNTVYRARLQRDAGGILTGVETMTREVLADESGATMRLNWSDAEGMDLRPDGTLFVAFEGRRRQISQFGADLRRQRILPVARGWDALPNNASLEALAIDAAGRIHVIPETPHDGAFAVYRWNGRRWRIAGRVPQRDGYAPVGADFGPDGALYLLERKFRLLFTNRISRLRPGAWDAPETLIETGYGTLDNHEGISVTRDSGGQLWATTVSDDNLSRLQRTEIAEFALP